jgi:hypothetical protein
MGKLKATTRFKANTSQDGIREFEEMYFLCGKNIYLLARHYCNSRSTLGTEARSLKLDMRGCETYGYAQKI